MLSLVPIQKQCLAFVYQKNWLEKKNSDKLFCLIASLFAGAIILHWFWKFLFINIKYENYINKTLIKFSLSRAYQ